MSEKSEHEVSNVKTSQIVQTTLQLGRSKRRSNLIQPAQDKQILDAVFWELAGIAFLVYKEDGPHLDRGGSS